MRPLGERLRRREPLIADGATGTMLIARGLPPGEAPERWTLERPSEIEQVALAYVESGAELLTTNTFGASPLRLRMHGLEGRTDELNARAVELARDASDGRAYVLGSIGPTGRLLKPMGDVDHQLVLDGFRRQSAALAGAGADAIVIETMMDLEEAAIALEAVKEEAPALPVLVTLTFDVTPRGPFTTMGVSVVSACARLQDGGADAIGANCGTGPEPMLAVARAFAETSTLPLIFQPNAGLPMRRNGQLVYPQPPEAFAEQAARLAPLCVIVGGCCGTTPAHIAALRRRLGE
ncbi:MAG TPA: homocysteine S-methyltransferase family protein [Vicinamibacterales bacterium]|nr:homocysteine S-methyltransferase family protein [Vicinamibacterales bacterium]